MKKHINISSVLKYYSFLESYHFLAPFASCGRGITKVSKQKIPMTLSQDSIKCLSIRSSPIYLPSSSIPIPKLSLRRSLKSLSTCTSAAPPKNQPAFNQICAKFQIQKTQRLTDRNYSKVYQSSNRGNANLCINLAIVYPAFSKKRSSHHRNLQEDL